MATTERALALLSAPGAVLAASRDGRAFAIYPRGDRRRRPAARLAPSEVAALASDGAIAFERELGYVITVAGRARSRREAAPPHEAFAAQHAAIVERQVIDTDAEVRAARAVASGAAITRLSALKDAKGRPWLDGDELRAARMLRADWEAQQAGLMRGSDWSAAPQGTSARGPANAQERRLAERCDRRKRFAKAMDALAPPLWRVLHSTCIREEGLETLERAEGWPARSAKLALKLGLAQLAAIYAAARASA
ncbi:MAG: hypothetical protein K2P58_01660 [Hyphomonadaceae bacterium]|nr:hypothetical protein [Hyphomonadaceae bacterium]